MKRRLIKIIALALVLVTGLSFLSCGNKLKIDGEDMKWRLVIITSDKTGEVVYCSAENKIYYDNAKVIDLSCRAADGKIIITDKKTEIGYLGTYTVISEGKQSSYSVAMTSDGERIDGEAEITKTKLHDDSFEYNLIIVIDGYTLNFKSVEANK